VANLRSGDVSILLGNGDGSFQTARSIGADSAPSSVAVADVNGDGVEDLVVANLSNDVSVVFGNGDGSFQATPNFGVGGGASSVAVGDFNRDGLADLAVAGSLGIVSVLLGNRDGSFQPARNFNADSGSSQVVVSDFNGDGVEDLATFNDSGSVSVLFGNGDGSFQPPRNSSALRPCACLTAADFNQDGVADLAMAVVFRDYATIMLGNGDGTFQPSINLNTPQGTEAQCVAVGDFNGDGVPDAAVTSIPFIGPDVHYVSIFLGNGDGSFQPADIYVLGGRDFPVVILAADFNGDGVPDLAVATAYNTLVSVLLGLGDGHFLQLGSSAAGGSARSAAVADFNGDGVPDLAVVHGDIGIGVSVLLGRGDGYFPLITPNFGAGGFPASVAVGDFNADGMPDLAVANSGSNNVSVLINNTRR